MPPPEPVRKHAPSALTGRVLLGFAGAALACALIAGLHYRYGGEYADRHVALFEFQRAGGELTQAVLDVAIAEDGGEQARRRPALLRVVGALDAIEARKGDVAGAANDAELANALREVRSVASGMLSAALMDARSHTRLQVAYSTAGRLLESRAAAGRAGMALLKAEQNRLFSSVVALTFLFIAFSAMELARTRRVGLAAERRVARITQLYRAQSRINEAVAHAADFSALAAEVCRIAVEDGGLECAIVRRHDATDDTLRLVAFHAPRTGLIGREVLPARDVLGVSAVAFGQLSRVVVDDMADSPITRHAAGDAARVGVRSAAGFALVSDGTAFGTLAVFGPGSGFFDAEMADLLEECAQTLSFAFGQLAAQNAMRESEARYRTLTETSPDANIVIRDGRIAMVNGAALRMFDIADAGYVLGHSPLDYVAPQMRDITAARIAGVMRDRKPAERHESILLRPDGSNFEVEAVTVPFDFDGGPAALVIARDITERRAADQRLIATSRLYEALSNTNAAIARESSFVATGAAVCQTLVNTGGLLSAAVFICKADGESIERVAVHGERALEMHRQEVRLGDPDALSSTALRNRFPQIARDLDGSAATRARSALMKAAGASAAAAFPLLARTGPIGTLVVTAGSSDAFDSKTVQLLCEVAEALAQAHARHASEATRIESERRVTAIVESAMDAILTCDENLRIVVFNAAAASMFGIRQGDATGLHLEQFLPQRFRERHAGWMRDFHASNKTSRAMGAQGTVLALRADGREFPTEASISSTTIGGRAFFTVIMRDISVRVAAESRIARLSSLYAALSRANEAIAREHDWHALCDAVCRIIVEHGKVVSAVIRMPDRDAAWLVPFAGAGPLGGSIGAERFEVTADHVVAASFRECRAIRVDDLADHAGGSAEYAAQIAEQATRQGIRSAIVVPIAREGRPVGMLSVFAATPGHFDDELAHLLDDLANDLAFAYDKLESDAAIRESEARYRTLFETSPDAIRIVCDDRVVMVNPAYQRLFGPVQVGRAIEDAVFGASEPAARERMAMRLRQVLEDRQPVPPDEQLFTLPDGRQVAMEVTSVPFVFDGRPAVLTILRDLTDQRARQQALEEAERRYRSLVETSLSGITLLHAGRFDYVNHGLLHLLGLERPDQLLGRHFSDVTHPESVAAISATLRTLEEAPGSSFPRGRTRLVPSDGRVIDVEVAAASILLDGRIMVLTEVRDVSGEVAAQKELQALNRGLEERIAERTAALSDANRNLQAANHDLESFSYSVAHDLRAPLRNMIGFANLLKIDIDAQNLAAVPMHADRVVASAERMNGLIDGLLAVSRVSHGVLRDARVDFAALLSEVLRDAAPAAHVQFHVGPLPVVNCDASTMRQVWANLISNAIKYSAKRDEPRVIITARPAADECVFDVRDNGAGFDPAYAERLFGVFQRLHSSREFEGNGVGLAIVRRIVERHGGRVWAEGAPGVGATFHFSLPAARVLDARDVRVAP